VGSRKAGQKLHNNLAVMRKQRKLTQADLAEESGLMQRTVARVERRQVFPTLRTRLALLKALGMREEEEGVLFPGARPRRQLQR
jgi:transcriptional regulator with XRE-family HTH domain